MRRRQFVAALCGTAAAWPMRPIAALALNAPIRIGFLASGPATSMFVAYKIELIKKGLKDNGLVEARDYLLDVRYGAGNYEQFSEIVRQLAQAGVGAILANTPASVRAAQRLTPPVPVIMLAINDPVGAGLVASLAVPGGHTTGTSNLNPDLTPKILEFIQAIIPKAAVVAALTNPLNPTHPVMLARLGSEAGKIGMTVMPFELSSADGLDDVFSRIAQLRPDALQIVSDSGNLDLSDRIAALALAHRLPTFSSTPSFVKFGGLLSYGAPIEPFFLRAGYFVARILNGAKPAELPVEQATRIELWINLKTAAALGIDVPTSLVARADEVIE
ncbi:ABC transporter substrate-binding protein [Bradyrhizobium sp.]|uniref:ABC transporter substrate-binding protein n=1 Tax=Bradyrhizobium sp. TaxID=376 RepID=UPI0023984BC5|nr:ABC transporter substrate-binding protein [Bradyrhizobium sp.]MDE2378379.1 ABC transporter substrate-binding protein [Bradyrhizobium sp.]